MSARVVKPFDLLAAGAMKVSSPHWTIFATGWGYGFTKSNFNQELFGLDTKQVMVIYLKLSANCVAPH